MAKSILERHTTLTSLNLYGESVNDAQGGRVSTTRVCFGVVLRVEARLSLHPAHPPFNTWALTLLSRYECARRR